MKTFQDRATAHAYGSTLLTAAIVVPLNTIFGLFAAWAVTRSHSVVVRCSSRSSTCPSGSRRLSAAYPRSDLWTAALLGPVLLSEPGTSQQLHRPLHLRSRHQGHPSVKPAYHPCNDLCDFPLCRPRPHSAHAGPRTQGRRGAAMTLGANGWQIFTRVTVPRSSGALSTA